MRSKTRNVLIAVLLLIIGGAAIYFGTINSSNTNQQNIIDVSWPNCASSSPSNNTYGVVGVTGGLDFRSNPCLANESSWFLHTSLYINTGYAGIERAREFLNYPKDCSYNNESCLAYNYGFNSAKYAILYANNSGVHSTLWWLDVETENSWSNNPSYNRDDIQGTIDAIKDLTFLSKVGIYSTPLQWSAITNNWHPNLISWVGTGTDSYLIAKNYCSASSFDGGSVWLSQYILELDNDYVCNKQFFMLSTGFHNSNN